MRIFLRVLAGLAFLVLIAAFFFVVPPLIQTNKVEPPIPSEAELRELLTVENGPTRVRYVNTSTQQLPDGVLGHTVILAEWADGTVFMIDAGMDRAAAEQFGELLETALGAEEASFQGDIVTLMGDGIQHVQGVGFTHLHIDHTQGVQPFCEARGQGVSAFQTRLQAEVHNRNTTEGGAIVADSCLSTETLSGEGILTPAGFPGLGMVALGGHTPGSTLFAIASQGRLWLFSGDTTNTKAEILTNTGKPFLYSYVFVPENTSRTEELRLWLAKLDANEDVTVVVSHDLNDLQASGMAEYMQ